MTVLLAAYYYKPHFGGIENSLYSLAKEYNRKGDDVMIVASDAALDKSKRLPPYEIVDGIPVFRFRHFIPFFGLFHLFAPLYDMVSCWVLIRKIRATKSIDKVLVRHHITALPLLSFHWKSLIYIVPGVVKNQDSLPLKHSRDQQIKTKLINWYSYYLLVSQQVWIQNMVFRKCKRIGVFSNTMKLQIIESAGGHSIANKIELVSPGVDLQRFSEYDTNRKKYREEEHLENDFVFLCIGRITLHKGFDLAIRAFALLHQRQPNKKLKLLIVGEGPEVGKLKALVNELQLEKLVIIKGKTVIPEKYYAISDAFIMSSIYEPFGQTIIEAMASGLPIIAFNSGGEVDTATSQIIKNGVNGLLCPFSIDHLSQSMDQIALMSYDQLEEIKKQNREYIKTNYSWTNLIELI